MKLHVENMKLHGNGNQTGYKKITGTYFCGVPPVGNYFRTGQRNWKETGQHKNYSLASEKRYSVSLKTFDKNTSAKTPIAPFFTKAPAPNPP